MQQRKAPRRLIAAGVRRPTTDPRPSFTVQQCGTAVVKITTRRAAA